VLAVEQGGAGRITMVAEAPGLETDGERWRKKRRKKKSRVSEAKSAFRAFGGARENSVMFGAGQKLSADVGV
jgi:hypothetical protein